jgi:hypothetical protein
MLLVKAKKVLPFSLNIGELLRRMGSAIHVTIGAKLRQVRLMDSPLSVELIEAMLGDFSVIIFGH